LVLFKFVFSKFRIHIDDDKSKRFPLNDFGNNRTDFLHFLIVYYEIRQYEAEFGVMPGYSNRFREIGRIETD
jgi:hypothetical protein